MTIQLLSDQLASQIAAGEVVERPSSVVKELVENALDAGATIINIDVRDGGRTSIQISDNGCGIPAADLEIAFLRHATSKLQTVDDLNAIYTLGFRGEALAAIAAVSKITVVSRATAESAGIRLQLDGGIRQSRDTVGAPQGTVISVENIFYNVPARLKFLKSDATERKLIDEFVVRYALAYPQVRFRLIHNGRITFQTSGSGHILDVLITIYGPEIARQLLTIGQDEPIADDPPAITITGFIGPPSVHWANRSHIVLFVNGRLVKDNQLTYAIIQAYHTLLPSGRYPLALLFIEMPADQVDVNVHPTKTEVRFRGDKPPFGLVQRMVRQTLVADAPTRQMSAWAMGNQPEATGWGGEMGQPVFARSEPPEQSSLGLAWPEPPAATAPETETDASSGGLPIMRVVGQVGAAYIITEGPEGLFLIDQQAAHERILYDLYMSAWQRQQMPTHTLASGTAVSLAPHQAELVQHHSATFAKLGFQLEPFGPHTFMVRSVPIWAAEHDPAQLIVQTAHALERPSADDLPRHLIRTLSSQMAIRQGQALTHTQMTSLIQQLEQCRDPFTNPQGSPTFIYLSVAQLAREFGRL